MGSKLSWSNWSSAKSYNFTITEQPQIHSSHICRQWPIRLRKMCRFLSKVYRYKAQLRDLIAATSLMTLFGPCDLEIGLMSMEINLAPFLFHSKRCSSFHSYLWIETIAIVRNLWNRGQIGDFEALETLKFDGWQWDASPMRIEALGIIL